MVAIFRTVFTWWAFVVLVCVFLLQMTAGRPRLRHAHRKLRCSKCPPGWGVVELCGTSRDTTCRPCTPGSYSPHHSFHAPCWVCSRCGPGLYEAHACSTAADTVCDGCHRTGVVGNTDYDRHCGGT